MSSVAATVFDFDRKPSRRLWIFAAVAALALHVGGAALAIVHLQEEPSGAELGAQGFDVGLVFGSERAEVTDLPPGPDTNESAASPALAEQKAVEKESDLPKATPVEDENPDRIVTTNDAKKPQEEEQQVAAVPTPASDPSVAQEATAKQDLGVEGSGVIDQGLARDRRKAEAEYNSIISAVIERNKQRHYPKNAKRKSTSVKVSFALNRLGDVIQVDVMESAGDPAYDTAAVSLIRSCKFPKPPAKVTEDTISRTVTVNFNEKK